MIKRQKLGEILVRVIPGAKNRRSASRIVESSYFDCEYYSLWLGTQGSKKEIEIRNHFRKFGYSAGASPTRYFSPDYYLFQCRESKIELSKKVNPFQHYLEHGWKLGFDPHPLISNRYYVERYPDVKHANFEPIFHFVNHGLREGRNLNPWFSQEFESDSLRYFADPVELRVDETLYLAKLQARVCWSELNQ